MLDEPFNYLSGIVGAPPDHLKVSSMYLSMSARWLILMFPPAHLHSIGFLSPWAPLHPTPIIQTSVQGSFFDSDVMLLPARPLQDVLGILPVARRQCAGLADSEKRSWCWKRWQRARVDALGGLRVSSIHRD